MAGEVTSSPESSQSSH